MPVSGTPIKNTNFRVYSGNSPTPYYVQAIQMEQPNIDITVPRPTTGIQLDGGRMTANVITYIEDEAVPFQPRDATFKIFHRSDALEFLDAFGNPLNKSPWVIGGHTWTGLALNALGSHKNSDNVAVPALYPADVPQQANMVTICWKHSVPADAPSGTALVVAVYGFVYERVNDMVEGQLRSFEITGKLWGGVNATLTDWPTGTESIPS